jgi:hypothetical protein
LKGDAVTVRIDDETAREIAALAVNDVLISGNVDGAAACLSLLDAMTSAGIRSVSHLCESDLLIIVATPFGDSPFKD